MLTIEFGMSYLPVGNHCPFPQRESALMLEIIISNPLNFVTSNDSDLKVHSERLLAHCLLSSLQSANVYVTNSKFSFLTIRASSNYYNANSWNPSKRQLPCWLASATGKENENSFSK